MTTNTFTDVEVPAADKEKIEEVQWTDDSIRWEGGLHVKKDTDTNDKESSDEEDYMFDPFKDPDPFEIFPFQFERPVDINSSSCCEGDVEKKESNLIQIQIRGYKTDADEVWQSTGLTLWRASDYLCQYQMENLDLFQNKRILELGAGLGLNGILAWKSACSSSEVCITDGDIDALVHLRGNVERNRRCDDDDDVGKVSCHQLIWGKESSEQFLSHAAHNGKYDVILASDIIYSPVIVEPLWETVEILLMKPNNGCEKDDEGGVFIMAYAKRKVPVSIKLVCETAVAHGFEYRLVKEGDGDDDGIWVYTFRFSG